MSLKKSPNTTSSSPKEVVSQPEDNEVFRDTTPAREITTNPVQPEHINISLLSAAFGKYEGRPIFRMKMKEELIKQNLFMLEEEPYYEQLTLRGKINAIAKRSDTNIHKWYYNMGVTGTLPDNYERFKEMLIEKIKGDSFSDIRKYTDEKWGNYISRIYKEGKVLKIQEREILEKIRRTPAPKDIQNILYTPGATIEQIKDTVIQWERIYERI